MSGVRLEARVHMVTAASTAVANLKKCAERCDLYVSDVVLQPLASADAVLSEDEKEIGVALVDIGGGTTDIIIYVDGAVVHTSVIPIGGINLTNDIATGLRTTCSSCETPGHWVSVVRGAVLGMSSKAMRQALKKRFGIFGSISAYCSLLFCRC